MIDTAKLREALVVLEGIGSRRGNAHINDPIYNAARELLTIREAGALIITPDENGVWPEWVIDFLERHLVSRAEAPELLDALRDATPDGSGE